MDLHTYLLDYSREAVLHHTLITPNLQRNFLTNRFISRLSLDRFIYFQNSGVQMSFSFLLIIGFNDVKRLRTNISNCH